ncbi:MAG: hypothetical protein NC254_04580 [bacterium]|nr:hypothetical protein [bacterium]
MIGGQPALWQMTIRDRIDNGKDRAAGREERFGPQKSNRRMTVVINRNGG